MGGGGGRTFDNPVSMISPSSLLPPLVELLLSFEFPRTIVVRVGITATPPVGA